MKDEKYHNKPTQILIDGAGDAIIIGDDKGTLIQANQKMLDLSGYTINELLGTHITSLFSQEELLAKPLRFDLLQSNIPVLMERDFQLKNGSILPIEMHSSKTQNGYLSIIRDISKRKAIEKKLEEQMKRLSLVTEMEKIGILDYDIENDQLHYNHEMCKIMGLAVSPDCTKFKKWINSIHPDDKNRVEESVKSVEINKTTIEFFYRLIEPITNRTKFIKAIAHHHFNLSKNKQSIIITSVDISDTNYLKSQLKESEGTFVSLTETTPSAIFIYNEKFLYVNSAFTKITGYSKQEACDLNFWDVIHPDQRELVMERGMKRLAGKDITKKYEIQLITKTGETKWIEFAADRTIYQGKPAGIGTAFDITERMIIEANIIKSNKQLEAQSRKAEASENKFRQYIEQNSAPMMAIDTTTNKVIFANKAAASLYGYTREEMLTLSIPDFHDISEEDINEKLSAALNEENNIFNFQHFTKTKKIFNVKINASPVVIDDKVTMILIIRDMTESNLMKSELKLSHDTYRNILNSISEMVYILDKDGQFLFVNEAAKRKYGYNKIDFIGKTPAFLSPKGMNDLEAVGRNLQNAYMGQVNTFEFYGLKKDGTVFPKEVIVSPGFFFDQKVIIAVSRDITQHKLITNELTLAKEKAEENDQLKSAFLANMSHEIRTPMNAILGFSELVNEPDIDEDERSRFLKIINKSSYHLLNLINDLVDISKIQANQMKIILNPINLNLLLNEVIDHFAGEIINTEKENKVKIVSSYDLSNSNDTINTDPTRLQQVLHNIIGNAIKFTSKGIIEVAYKINNDTINFCISDEGIGISQDNQDKIFERFSQANSTISKEFGGTGLGLSIAKACTELLGGNIWVESEFNVGTQLYFTIPFIPS